MTKIGLFERDKEWRELCAEMADEHGHEIVVSAGEYDEALALIDGLNQGYISAAIVGSRLGGPNAFAGDGTDLARRLHEVGDITVIALTGDSEGVPGAEHSVQKLMKDDTDPLKVIAGILGSIVTK